MARYDHKIKKSIPKISLLDAIRETNRLEGNPNEVFIVFESIIEKRISNFDYKLSFDSLCSDCGSIHKNEFHYNSKEALKLNLEHFLRENPSVMLCSPLYII